MTMAPLFYFMTLPNYNLKKFTCLLRAALRASCIGASDIGLEGIESDIYGAQHSKQNKTNFFPYPSIAHNLGAIWTYIT
jgi:hypothetical protein